MDADVCCCYPPTSCIMRVVRLSPMLDQSPNPEATELCAVEQVYGVCFCLAEET